MAQPHPLSLEEDMREELILILQKGVSQMRNPEQEDLSPPYFKYATVKVPHCSGYENGGKNSNYSRTSSGSKHFDACCGLSLPMEGVQQSYQWEMPQCHSQLQEMKLRLRG